MNKNYSLAGYIVSFIVLILFLLLGLVLTIFSLQTLFIGISGIGLSGILYLLVGIYLIYKPVRYIRSLIKKKNNFNEIFNGFIRENNKVIIITLILSVVLLSLFYSGISTNFDFYVNVVLFLPKFFLDNLVFIVNIFLLRYNLMYLEPLMDLIFPISEVIFLFEVSKFISKLLKRKS